MLKQGLSKSQAAKALGYSTGSIGMLDKAIERKSQNFSLVSDSNVRIAHRTVKLIAQGKTFGSIETVRASDALRASEVILDRAEPKAQDVRPPTFNYTVINMDIFKNEPENPPIEVSAEVMSGNDTPEKVSLETSLNSKGNIDS